MCHRGIDDLPYQAWPSQIDLSRFEVAEGPPTVRGGDSPVIFIRPIAENTSFLG